MVWGAYTVWGVCGSGSTYGLGRIWVEEHIWSEVFMVWGACMGWDDWSSAARRVCAAPSFDPRSGFRVQDSGCRVQGSRFGVESTTYMVLGVYRLGSVYGLGYMLWSAYMVRGVYGLWCGVGCGACLVVRIRFGERIWSGVYMVRGAWSSAARSLCRSGFRVESTAYMVWGVYGLGRYMVWGVYGLRCIWF
jgi:hypothetical protein